MARPKSAGEWHMLSARIPVDLYRRVEKAAARQGVSVSYWVRETVAAADDVRESDDMEPSVPRETNHKVVLTRRPDAPAIIPDVPQPLAITVPECDHPSSRRVGETCMRCHQKVGSAL